eukprot:351705-Chlamydomonas_euryale.AAC.2
MPLACRATRRAEEAVARWCEQSMCGQTCVWACADACLGRRRRLHYPESSMEGSSTFRAQSAPLDTHARRATAALTTAGQVYTSTLLHQRPKAPDRTW